MPQPSDLTYAQKLDQQDPLAGFREAFYFPYRPDGSPVIYLCGNSLGLQPTGARGEVEKELDAWATLAVDGHFEGDAPWYNYHESFSRALSPIVGAKPDEIIVMNTLTVNLHLMMISFYKPDAQRFKILIEDAAFCSDHYAVESQAKLHGWAPEDAVIKLRPRAGEEALRDEDILAAIREHSDQLALIMLGGVNYYTGQVFDMAEITRVGHEVGARVGFDLAHAVGNIELGLHQWGVDFAVWCSYKYLNAGPGAIAGCFVHERWRMAPELPRLAGWWGYDQETRFEMLPNFHPQPGAAGWQLSNAPILAMAPQLASLRLFNRAGMPALRQKSLALTDYLLQLLDTIPSEAFEVITPREADRRGAQLSLKFRENGEAIFAALQAAGVVGDWRKPDVIRVAPAPLYNSFEDVWRFCDILQRALV